MPASTEVLLVLTLNEPVVGTIVNLDGDRYRITRVLRWTGTVARIEVERIADDDDV